MAWAKSRPLNIDTPEKLASSFNGLFAIGVGIAQSPALFGFVGFFITGRLWVYVEGMAFSVIGLWLIAPTERNLQKNQE